MLTMSLWHHLISKIFLWLTIKSIKLWQKQKFIFLWFTISHSHSVLQTELMEISRRIRLLIILIIIFKKWSLWQFYIYSLSLSYHKRQHMQFRRYFLFLWSSRFLSHCVLFIFVQIVSDMRYSLPHFSAYVYELRR